MVQMKDMKLKSEVYKENQMVTCIREGDTAWWRGEFGELGELGELGNRELPTKLCAGCNYEVAG